MRPPERLALSPPSGPIVRHSVLLSLEKRQREQIVPGPLWKNVSALDAYLITSVSRPDAYQTLPVLTFEFPDVVNFFPVSIRWEISEKFHDFSRLQVIERQ